LRYVLPVPVWGEFFRELWASIAAPSYLAPGNISALRRTGIVDILLFTGHEDSRWLAEHRWVRALAAMANVEFLHIPAAALAPETTENREGMQRKYQIHAECIRYALKRYADDPDAVLLPLTGDVFWTSGYGEAIAAALTGGSHAIASASVAVDLESVQPVLRALIDRAGPRAFESGAIVKLCLEHLHSKTLAQIWTCGISCENFSYFYWSVENGGLVCHATHPVPVAFHLGRIDRKAVEFFGTIDMNFIFMAVPDTSNIAILDDSMKGCSLELVRANDQHPKIRHSPWTPEGLGAELANFRNWGLLFDPATQSRVALTPVRFRYGPVGDEWTRVEMQSRHLIQATLDRIVAAPST